MTNPRKRRANGEASRRKIIEAATAIASERGYQATSISAVSERSGLPPSSIYWHFQDKDDLIAAVIQDSFETWRAHAAWSGDFDDADPQRALVASMRSSGRALREAPHFLRLGLMLALERRPEDPTASTMFLEVRRGTREQVARLFKRLFGDALDDASVTTLAIMAIAAADGLFIAREIEGAAVDTDTAFDLFGIALDAVAHHLIEAKPEHAPKRRRGARARHSHAGTASGTAADPTSNPS